MIETIRQEEVQKNPMTFDCKQCVKTFASPNDLSIHNQVKHDKKGPAKDDLNEGKQQQKKRVSAKVLKVLRQAGSARKPSKNKELIEYHQLEDKIYTFLGEIGTKMGQGEPTEAGLEEDLERDSAPDKVGVFSNYLDNYVIRLPFEPEFPITLDLVYDLLPLGERRPFFELMIQDMLKLHSQLEAEKLKWVFLDPAEQKGAGQLPYTLLDVRSLTAGGQQRGAVIAFPQSSIFLLWIARVCKVAAWREIAALILMVRVEFEDYMFGLQIKRAPATWKQFFTMLIDKIKAKTVMPITTFSNLFEETELISFLRLYAKWVTSINCL